MIDPSGPLALALSSGAIGGLVAPDSPAFDTLDAAARRYVRPVSVAVTGRRGVGRDTMADALHRRFGVTASVTGDGRDVLAADLVVHVLAGAPRRSDRQILAASPRERTVVVLGKADTLDADAVDRIVRAACDSLGTPVVAVSQLSASVKVSEADLEFLRGLVEAGETLPSMSGRFLAAAPAHSPSWRMRSDMLRRLDAAGIRCALSLIARDDAAAADAATLTEYLWGTSGFDGLSVELGARMPAVAEHRAAHVRASLESAAAAGADRDNIELLLRTGGG
ncbi:hypothetical protein [Gordonia aichiensis]|uniref:Uncharacterized protein n=1 Tax=Gordonia aichiensis NBRC 108223 TaxID=1220583 RepID=L7KNR6_9ACTN|nr:hypothetical protein [Gordonia aichiensis]GAC50480.1 hypothetical protein GOACH_25_00160 [Gordonia aichiensis NBRC 108223]